MMSDLRTTTYVRWPSGQKFIYSLANAVRRSGIPFYQRLGLSASTSPCGRLSLAATWTSHLRLAL